ncbi:MAG TPA: choice-of-anchor tandem repeat GloVer-containing protein [Rhizomicrobium sp.]|jgi:uncharacterized repeat protein (TIGR03803 family)|nr:choice-of-anchor tandem repeat GloVer-containing protein [Rhizomicrobium sp.]
MTQKLVQLIPIKFLLPLSLLVFATFNAANASMFSVLHTFKGGRDGSGPFGRLMMDKKGNLLGVTTDGGRSCRDARYGCGTVYEVTPTGAHTVLFFFHPEGDGIFPTGLAQDKLGNIYGTTLLGGSRVDHARPLGTVFKLAPDGTETVLHTFTGPDGSSPIGLTKDATGNLYGSSQTNSFYGCCGLVFKVAADGAESTFHTFTGGNDGGDPVARVIADSAGNLYGATAWGGGTGCGGYGCGTVYKLAPDGTETILYAFSGGADGESPEAPLKMDDGGNLYGTADGGGANGFGVVFKLTPSGVESVLHSFAGGSDGRGTFMNGLYLDSSGNVYGATTYGGGTGCAGYGCGTVYRIAPDGKERILHSFAGQTDGAFPATDLILDEAGNLYGTAQVGGETEESCCGTVFKLTP